MNLENVQELALDVIAQNHEAARARQQEAEELARLQAVLAETIAKREAVYVALANVAVVATVEVPGAGYRPWAIRVGNVDTPEGSRDLYATVNSVASRGDQPQGAIVSSITVGAHIAGRPEDFEHGLFPDKSFVYIAADDERGVQLLNTYRLGEETYHADTIHSPVGADNTSVSVPLRPMESLETAEAIRAHTQLVQSELLPMTDSYNMINSDLID